jgi:hypothetical protein
VIPRHVVARSREGGGVGYYVRVLVFNRTHYMLFSLLMKCNAALMHHSR